MDVILKDCIIYGTGNLGERAYNQYNKKMNILFFVDSDKRKWGRHFCGLPIKPPEEICNWLDVLVLIAIMYGDKAVLSRVKGFGVENVKTYNPNVDQSVEYKLVEAKRSTYSILVDAGLGMERELPTGTERLVRKICKEINLIKADVIFINNYDNNIVREFRYRNNEPNCDSNNLVKQVITLKAKDILLFVTPGIFGYFFEMIEKLKETNVEIFVIIYDMYKFYKSHMIASHLRKLWIDNFFCAMNLATGVLCYSNSVANEVKEYYNRGNICRSEPLNIFLFPLGADIVSGNKVKNVREKFCDCFNCDTVFLMVGSLRKHKGYRTVVEAFKRFHSYVNVKLLILGQCISKADESLKNDVIEAANKFENIIWINDATDEEVTYSYQHASALIAASEYEGFGLPLIEAAQYGLPLICSDIPIFREVTCGNADFFRVGDVESLSEILKKWLCTDTHPDSSKIPIHTWKESAEALLDIVEGRAEPYMTLE